MSGKLGPWLAVLYLFGSFSFEGCQTGAFHRLQVPLLNSKVLTAFSGQTFPANGVVGRVTPTLPSPEETPPVEGRGSQGSRSRIETLGNIRTVVQRSAAQSRGGFLGLVPVAPRVLVTSHEAWLRVAEATCRGRGNSWPSPQASPPVGLRPSVSGKLATFAPGSTSSSTGCCCHIRCIGEKTRLPLRFLSWWGVLGSGAPRGSRMPRAASWSTGWGSLPWLPDLRRLHGAGEQR